MKVACALITHLRVKAEVKREPRLEGVPVIIVDRNHSRPLVIDSSPGEAAVAPGATLEQALSLCPGAMALEADDSHYRRVFGRVLTALMEVSDRVEAADLGTAYVGIDGLESMYGGEARLVTTLLNAIPRWLNPRIGVGEGKFTALVAARDSRPLGASRVPLHPAAFLAPHSIDLLPMSAGTRDALHRFGLHTLGQIAAVPSDLLVDRFGHEGWLAWTLANGNDDSPLVPIKHEETVVERASLPFSSTSLELLLVVGGYAAAPGLRPSGNTRTVRRQSSAGMRRFSRRPLAEVHCLPGRSKPVGAGLLHRPQPPGGRASPVAH